jgi:hypothetical protein
MFVWENGSGGISFATDVNKVDLKKKCLVIVKTDPPAPAQKDIENSTNIIARVVFMEFNRPILESLHNYANVSHQTSFISAEA